MHIPLKYQILHTDCIMPESKKLFYFQYLLRTELAAEQNIVFTQAIKISLLFQWGYKLIE